MHLLSLEGANLLFISRQNATKLFTLKLFKNTRKELYIYYGPNNKEQCDSYYDAHYYQKSFQSKILNRKVGPPNIPWKMVPITIKAAPLLEPPTPKYPITPAIKPSTKDSRQILSLFSESHSIIFPMPVFPPFKPLLRRHYVTRTSARSLKDSLLIFFIELFFESNHYNTGSRS